MVNRGVSGKFSVFVFRVFIGWGVYALLCLGFACDFGWFCAVCLLGWGCYCDLILCGFDLCGFGVVLSLDSKWLSL